MQQSTTTGKNNAQCGMSLKTYLNVSPREACESLWDCDFWGVKNDSLPWPESLDSHTLKKKKRQNFSSNFCPLKLCKTNGKLSPCWSFTLWIPQHVHVAGDPRFITSENLDAITINHILAFITFIRYLGCVLNLLFTSKTSSSPNKRRYPVRTKNLPTPTSTAHRYHLHTYFTFCSKL